MLYLLLLCGIGNSAMKKDAATGCPKAIQRKKECDDFGQACVGVFWLVLGLGFILSFLGVIGS